VAEHFDWVHTIERLAIAQRLSAQRPPGLAPLQVCIQVNLDGGRNKAGVSAPEALALAQQLLALLVIQRAVQVQFHGQAVGALAFLAVVADQVHVQAVQRQAALLGIEHQGQGLAGAQGGVEQVVRLGAGGAAAEGFGDIGVQQVWAYLDAVAQAGFGADADHGGSRARWVDPA